MIPQHNPHVLEVPSTAAPEPSVHIPPYKTVIESSPTLQNSDPNTALASQSTVVIQSLIARSSLRKFPVPWQLPFLLGEVSLDHHLVYRLNV